MTDDQQQDEVIATQAAAWAVRLRADDVAEADWLAAAARLAAGPPHGPPFDQAEAPVARLAPAGRVPPLAGAPSTTSGPGARRRASILRPDAAPSRLCVDGWSRLRPWPLRLRLRSCWRRC